MTTAAQVKKLVQPLLEKNPDLAWVGRQIYLKPIHHFARTVLIDRLLDPDGFRPQWAVVHLFDLRRSFSLSWGEWLGKPSVPMSGSWRIHDPDVSQVLMEAIEQKALPHLRAMKSLDDYLAYVSQTPRGGLLFDVPTARIVVDVAKSDLKEALMIFEREQEHWSVDKPDYDDDDRAMLRRLRELSAYLVANDRAGLARLLHDWEAQTVKNFKIEHLWEPTPFPLELQMAR